LLVEKLSVSNNIILKSIASDLKKTTSNASFGNPCSNLILKYEAKSCINTKALSFEEQLKAASSALKPVSYSKSEPLKPNFLKKFDDKNLSGKETVALMSNINKQLEVRKCAMNSQAGIKKKIFKGSDKESDSDEESDSSSNDKD